MGTFKRLSPKLLRCSDLFGSPDLPIVTYAHYCAACDELHHFAVDKPFSNGARWIFNGNAASPTFQPSMNIRIGPFPAGSGPRDRTTGERTGTLSVCHYFLRDGRIQYLGDCTHDMSGMTTELQDVPASAVQWMTEKSDAA